jgi:hypothetical protein
MDANGKGLKVAYQVLDETRLLFQFFLRLCLRVSRIILMGVEFGYGV